MKKCPRCGKLKPESEYCKTRRTKDGLQCYCKVCTGKMQHEYYVKNRQRILDRQAAYYAQDPYLRKAVSAVYGKTERGNLARRNSLQKRRLWEREGDLTTEQLQKLFANVSHCPMCGREFGPRLKKTLDHIVPLSKGGVHTLSNCQVLCGRCNTKKGAK